MFFYDKSPVCPLTWFLGKWCLVPRPEWEMALNLLWYPDTDLSGKSILVYFTFIWGVFRDSAHMGARYFLDSFWVLSHVSPAASHTFGISKGSGFLISSFNCIASVWLDFSTLNSSRPWAQQALFTVMTTKVGKKALQCCWNSFTSRWRNRIS